MSTDRAAPRRIPNPILAGNLPERCLQEVVSRNPRAPSPLERRATFPGFAGLRTFIWELPAASQPLLAGRNARRARDLPKLVVLAHRP